MQLDATMLSLALNCISKFCKNNQKTIDHRSNERICIEMVELFMRFWEANENAFNLESFCRTLGSIGRIQLLMKKMKRPEFKDPLLKKIIYTELRKHLQGSMKLSMFDVLDLLTSIRGLELRDLDHK